MRNAVVGENRKKEGKEEAWIRRRKRRTGK